VVSGRHAFSVRPFAMPYPTLRIGLISCTLSACINRLRRYPTLWRRANFRCAFGTGSRIALLPFADYHLPFTNLMIAYAVTPILNVSDFGTLATNPTNRM
jgi:hypothetical protein